MQNMMQSFYGTTIFHFSYPKTTILLYFFFRGREIIQSLNLHIIAIETHSSLWYYTITLLLCMFADADDDGERGLRRKIEGGWRIKKKVDVIAEKVTGVEKTSIQSCIRDDSWGKSQFVHSKKIKWIKSSSYDYWCELLDRENSLHRCYFIYPVDIHGYKTMKWKTAAVKHWKICKQAYNEKNERGNNENLVFKLVSMNIEVWVDVWE